jgi:hypothetical protein
VPKLLLQMQVRVPVLVQEVGLTDRVGGRDFVDISVFVLQRFLVRGIYGFRFAGGPSVLGRNLQCELVRKVDTRDEYHWSHACSLQASRHGNQWHPRV